MNQPCNMTASQVTACCARLGKDPLLVQGAGGNVSWKEGEVLWVKASGTWLARAEEEAVFIPVDLAHVRSEIAAGNFAVSPKVLGDSTLRPSIETLMHALMPHRIVVHLHVIELLANLVRERCDISAIALPEEVKPVVVVDYFKPGAELARAIHDGVANAPSASIIFLKNHGVVIGAEQIEQVDHLLTILIETMKTTPMAAAVTPDVAALPETAHGDYIPLADADVHRLARDPALVNRLSADWALYPDHVVFLGPKPFVFASWAALNDFAASEPLPELVFIRDQGVFVHPAFSLAKQLQLRCYFDVLVRQKPDEKLRTLSGEQIAELLNWDAEQYRMSLSVKS
ncbi:class II aldolase/adducin family protein [Erwinia psidii]|uniref:Class II aldolase n=1 Tax=Erwinia psidii TaxID=69224 RepID=A0A3N6UUZ2_9GAMM|nr:class II aldolase/adducin family protein [Erwinia psidii]MCX8956438.1 class II aldolase [Erwinia psidii]MCX8962284.1 class II aldolase [Erwinia psidii]RQM39769.1 class II aldolase [Erwinia psidii]